MSNAARIVGSRATFSAATRHDGKPPLDLDRLMLQRRALLSTATMHRTVNRCGFAPSASPAVLLPILASPNVCRPIFVRRRRPIRTAKLHAQDQSAWALFP